MRLLFRLWRIAVTFMIDDPSSNHISHTIPRPFSRHTCFTPLITLLTPLLCKPAANTGSQAAFIIKFSAHIIKYSALNLMPAAALNKKTALIILFASGIAKFTHHLMMVRALMAYTAAFKVKRER